MNRPSDLSRRRFLQIGAVAGGGLTFGMSLPGCSRTGELPKERFVANAWVTIHPDNRVVFLIDKIEMGQGVITSMSMLLADELEVPWDQIETETAGESEAYRNLWGLQATGGSLTIRTYWQPLRQAAATVRAMLCQAAADHWGTETDGCLAEQGVVRHLDSDRSLTYGQLAGAAARLTPPDGVAVKSPDQFRYIGKPMPLRERASKSDGSAEFGIDVQLPGLLTAVVVRCPVFGGKVASFDGEMALAVPGVLHVVQIPDGIGVVAESYWAARSGAGKLRVEWDNGPLAGLSSADIHDQFARALEQPGAQASQAGDVAAAVATASRVVEAEYAVPYLAHATMEPMNFTANVTAESCEMWGPTQAPTAAIMVAQQMTELPPEQISVHPSLLGGGFGRRFEADFMVDAVALSKAVGKPVKVVWSREEDTRHDFYRPATLNRLRAGLDENGQLLSWEHAIAGSSILSRSFPKFVKDGIDFSSVEGAANLPYGVANLDVNYHQVEPGVPVGFWRSVGSSQNAFVTEGFVDELAVAAGADPYEYRRNLLADHPRHRRVLERAAKHAGWGKPRPTGRFQGIAVHESFGSYVAQVAEISMADDGSVRVHRVVCVVDCGVVVNPDTVRAQMESGIVFGLSAALTGAITIEDGRVQQSNFHDYSVLRMNQMPEIEVHIVASDEAPGGVGEPGTPPIAPALVNAVYQATGKRLRQLPVDPALRQA